MTARLIAVASGIWLMFAPAVLGYGDPAAANDRIFGPIGASFAFVAIWEATRPLRWATLPVGVWLVLAPFLLQFEAPASIISSFVTGLIMASAAFGGGSVQNRFGGGWSSLWAREPGAKNSRDQT